MMQILLYLALLTGVIVKLVDDIVDERLWVTKELAVILGVIYGIFISIMIVRFPAVAPVYIAVLIGVLLTRKIDHLPHAAGIASVLFLLAAYGFPQVDVRLLFLFIFASIADELGDNLAEKRSMFGPLGKFLHHRLILEAAVLTASCITGKWEMFVGILLFDIGYILAGKATKKFRI